MTALWVPHDVFVLPSRSLPQPLWRKTNPTLTVQYKDIYKYKYEYKHAYKYTYKGKNKDNETDMLPPTVEEDQHLQAKEDVSQTLSSHGRDMT